MRLEYHLALSLILMIAFGFVIFIFIFIVVILVVAVVVVQNTIPISRAVLGRRAARRRGVERINKSPAITLLAADLNLFDRRRAPLRPRCISFPRPRSRQVILRTVCRHLAGSEGGMASEAVEGTGREAGGAAGSGGRGAGGRAERAFCSSVWAPACAGENL